MKTPKELLDDHGIMGWFEGRPIYCEVSDHEPPNEATVPVSHVGELAVWYPFGRMCWTLDPAHRLKSADA